MKPKLNINYSNQYIQSTNFCYNNSNQLSNYQLQYYLFKNIHYKQPTDLIKTCKTQMLYVLRQPKNFLIFIFYEKEISIIEIKRSNIFTEIKQSNINLINIYIYIKLLNKNNKRQTN